MSCKANNVTNDTEVYFYVFMVFYLATEQHTQLGLLNSIYVFE